MFPEHDLFTFKISLARDRDHKAHYEIVATEHGLLKKFESITLDDEVAQL